MKHNSKLKKVVIVTGCGSGIGLELAKKLYQRTDFRVVATARIKTLEQVRKLFIESENFILRELDVTNEDNIYSLIHEITLLWGRVDVVINNAAV